MNAVFEERTPRAWRGWLATEAVVCGYLAVIVVRNIVLHGGCAPGWRLELVRDSGWYGLGLVGLFAGAVFLAAAWVLRLKRASLVLSGQLILGIVLLESFGVYHHHQDELMKQSMTTLRDVAREIDQHRRSADGTLPERLSTSWPEASARDGWGNRLCYLRASPTEAFLVATGSDGRLEFQPSWGVRQKFPSARVERDIVVQFSSPNGFTFVIWPEGPAQGTPCAVASAFGCFSYWQ